MKTSLLMEMDMASMISSGLRLLLAADSTIGSGTSCVPDGFGTTAWTALANAAGVGAIHVAPRTRVRCVPLANISADDQTAVYRIWREVDVFQKGDPAPKAWERELFATVTANFKLARVQSTIAAVFGRDATAAGLYAAETLTVALASGATSPPGSGDAINTGFLSSLGAIAKFEPTSGGSGVGAPALKGAFYLPDVLYPSRLLVECLKGTANGGVNLAFEVVGPS